MKRSIFVLAILIAVPAFALNVELVDNGNGTINIEYSDADPCNLPRMFNLDLTMIDGSFTSISNYSVGESNDTSQGYGIYPAKINIDMYGDVNDWGNPLAAEGALGTSDQVLPSNHIVLEFGSLYYGEPNAPLTSGVLCTIGVEISGNIPTVTMVDEDTYRRGLVLEDGTEGEVSDVLTFGPCLSVGQVFSVACNPTVNLTVSQAMYDRWVNYGQPTCWCCNGQKCGDTNGSGRVDTQDLGALKQAWFLSYPSPGFNPCTDYNLSGRTDTVDLGILKSHWFRMVDPCPSLP
ncbi:MAG: hypothetical protein JW806_08745 [Sedimentisphaerales bacterium]|nr:hypothetical protein [Sedimentisphaerales bacterium]